MYVRWGQDEAGGLQKPTRRWGSKWEMAIESHNEPHPEYLSVSREIVDKIPEQCRGARAVHVFLQALVCVCVCEYASVVEAGSIRARGRGRTRMSMSEVLEIGNFGPVGGAVGRHMQRL